MIMVLQMLSVGVRIIIAERDQIKGRKCKLGLVWGGGGDS